MPAAKGGRRILGCLLAVVLVCAWLLPMATPAAADPSGDLYRQADNELRKAERLMYAGKAQEAATQLAEARKVMDQLKAADPGYSRLKSLERKFDQVKARIDKKLEQAGAAATASSASTSQAPTAAKPKAVKLPYEARRPMQQCNSDLSSVDYGIKSYEGQDQQSRQLTLKLMGPRLQQAKKNLAEARKLAAAKGMSDHPDFDEAQKRISEAEATYAKLQGGFQQAAAEAQAGADKVNGVVAELKALYEKLRAPYFDKCPGVPIYYNTLKEPGELIVVIEEFDSQVRPGLGKKLEAVAAEWGPTTQDMDNKGRQAGYQGSMSLGWYYGKLSEGADKVTATRTAMAEDLAAKANDTLGRMGQMHDFMRIKAHQDVRDWAAMAARYDAQNPKVKALTGSLDGRLEQDKKQFQAKIDGRKWPGNSDSDDGEAAFEFFQNSPDWGKRPSSAESRTPKGLAVTGKWSVQKRDITGKPVMFGLPVLLAVQVNTEKDMDVYRVYSLTVRTRERGGAKPEPPFESATVGDSYYIRPDAVD